MLKHSNFIWPCLNERLLAVHGFNSKLKWNEMKLYVHWTKILERLNEIALIIKILVSHFSNVRWMSLSVCTLKWVEVYIINVTLTFFKKPRVAVTNIDCSKVSWLNKFTHLISNQITKLPYSELRKYCSWIKKVTQFYKRS